MPLPVVPHTLAKLCLSSVSTHLSQHVLPDLDDLFKATNEPDSPRVSPTVSPVDPRLSRVLLPPRDLMEEQRDDRIQQLRDWIRQLPVHLQQELVDQLLLDIESQLYLDRDKKLILTLINLDRVKCSDFFFGVHTLLTMVNEETNGITRLGFGKGFWSCLWDYEQITTAHLMQKKLCQAIPNFSRITVLSLSFFGNDRMCYLLSRHVHNIEVLCLERSAVTTNGLVLLGGGSITKAAAARMGLTPQEVTSAIRPPSLEDASSSSENLLRHFSHSSEPRPRPRGSLLQKLDLEGCSQVTEAGIWWMITVCSKLKVLTYRQTSTLAEIINENVREMSLEQCQKENRYGGFSLNHYTHQFPYKLEVDTELMQKVNLTFPHITALNMVCEDNVLFKLTELKGLTHVTVEVEDGFGLGLDHMLATMGGQIKELVISCSSDPESAIMPEGGQKFQLFNTGMRLVQRYCSSVWPGGGGVTILKNLHISGCGLVSNNLMRRLEELEGPIGSRRREGRDVDSCSLRALECLIFLSYDNPVTLCDKRVLMDFITDCPNIKTLSLEGNCTTFYDDAFVSRMLERNPLSELGIMDINGFIKFPAADLTIVSARKLCLLPQIRELRLESWQLPQPQLDSLFALVKEKGWQLDVSKGRRGI